jgi:hypothetical protein
LFVDEALAFTAGSCGLDPGPLFERAAASALKAGQDWKASVYRQVATGTFTPEFGTADIPSRTEVPEGASGFVLGESSIHVRAGSKVGVQVERTVRDWFSYQIDFQLGGREVKLQDLLDYHEGARLRDLVESTEVTTIPLTGTLVARRGDQWFAPDESGVFRFEVLPDKVWYPTTRAYRDLALLVDTHGISSLVERAVTADVDLVIGCGDYVAKAQAAYHLASQGINVYFPCDRFVGELLGYDAEGTLIGSAPVRPEPGGAVIGDRPIEFRTDEVIVVQTTEMRGDFQYYDAADRYFERLNGILPLHLEKVMVDKPGQAARVIRRARETGATAIALRAWNDTDYLAVREWLIESPGHRAVLFHTAPYAAGYQLFGEFPHQTTFGDPRPRFLPPAEPSTASATVGG